MSITLGDGTPKKGQVYTPALIQLLKDVKNDVASNIDDYIKGNETANLDTANMPTNLLKLLIESNYPQISLGLDITHIDDVPTDDHIRNLEVQLEGKIDEQINPNTRFIPTSYSDTGKRTAEGYPIVKVANQFAPKFPVEDVRRTVALEISYDGGQSSVVSSNVLKVDPVIYSLQDTQEYGYYALIDDAFIKNNESIIKNFTKTASNAILSGDIGSLPPGYIVKSSTDLSTWQVRTDAVMTEEGNSFNITIPLNTFNGKPRTPEAKEFYSVFYDDKPDTNNIIMSAKLKKVGL